MSYPLKDGRQQQLPDESLDAIDAVEEGDTVFGAPGEYWFKEPIDLNKLHAPVYSII